MKRESWKSRLGFTCAAVGSAVGLANIWKFPYIVGQNGGAAFIAVYLICLLLIGFPVLLAEVVMGRRTRRNPYGAMKLLGGSRMWSIAGAMILFTVFLVTSFYSAVAGWILGYLVEALSGRMSEFQSPENAVSYYKVLISSPAWTLGFHFAFILACVGVLLGGVRKGIEKGTSFMMPVLFVVLIALVIKGLSLPNASKGLHFLLSPDWSLLTPAAVITALGHSFFTLSVGQGTMITYGSYLSERENIPLLCLPVALLDTLVSLLVAIVIFTTVFSAGIEPSAGPALIFHTLPYVFSNVSGGNLVAISFFFLVVLAALTSEISAMEPIIAYLIDEKGVQRKHAVILTALGGFLLGIPSALSTNLLRDFTFMGYDFLDMIGFVATSVLIPLGGFVVVIMVGWHWGAHNAMAHLREGAKSLFEKFPFLRAYFCFCFKYSAPILIVFVFLHALGLL